MPPFFVSTLSFRVPTCALSAAQTVISTYRCVPLGVLDGKSILTRVGDGAPVCVEVIVNVCSIVSSKTIVMLRIVPAFGTTIRVAPSASSGVKRWTAAAPVPTVVADSVQYSFGGGSARDDGARGPTASPARSVPATASASTAYVLIPSASGAGNMRGNR